MRLVHSITDQIREIQELWCKFTGKCEVASAQDDRIDWLREQQHASRRQQTLIRNLTGDDLEDELFGPLRKDQR